MGVPRMAFFVASFLIPFISPFYHCSVFFDFAIDCVPGYGNQMPEIHFINKRLFVNETQKHQRNSSSISPQYDLKLPTKEIIGNRRDTPTKITLKIDAIKRP